jgi:hypothetical protein
VQDQSPVTTVSTDRNIYKKFVSFLSTVEILVICALAAAVLMLASALTQMPKTLYAVALPVLEPPTSLLVALTGSKTVHEDTNKKRPAVQQICKYRLIDLKGFIL